MLCRLEVDLQREFGADYSVDFKSTPRLSPCIVSRAAENFILENPEWNYDNIPEIIDGKNIADFIDEDIMAVRRARIC